MPGHTQPLMSKGSESLVFLARGGTGQLTRLQPGCKGCRWTFHRRALLLPTISPPSAVRLPTHPHSCSVPFPPRSRTAHLLFPPHQFWETGLRLQTRKGNHLPANSPPGLGPLPVPRLLATSSVSDTQNTEG